MLKTTCIFVNNYEKTLQPDLVFKAFPNFKMKTKSAFSTSEKYSEVQKGFKLIIGL